MKSSLGVLAAFLVGSNGAFTEDGASKLLYEDRAFGRASDRRLKAEVIPPQFAIDAWIAAIEKRPLIEKQRPSVSGPTVEECGENVEETA